MFTHYGCLTDRWFPENSHGPLSADDFMGTSLEVLAPHAQKLLLPRGVRAMNEWSASGNTGQGNDPHTQVVGTYFTLVPVTPHTDDPFSFEEETRFRAMPTAPSLDHICARQLNPDKTPLFMRVGGRTETPQSAISYSAGEELFPGLATPAQAFGMLTGLFQNGDISPDTYRARSRKSIIDIVRDDLETLERNDMSQSDRRKLEAWKELLDQTGGVFAAAQCREEVALGLGLTEANFQVSEEMDGDILTATVADGLDYADLYSNIAVLSALCDQSRVIFLKYPANYVFRGLGLTTESHALSHRLSNVTNACPVGINDMLQTMDGYYAAKFAHLVQQLDSFEEGDATLLDNTAAVWFQEHSDGAAHNLNNMPIVQAGSCSGYFKTGHAVNVDDGTSNLHRGNSSIACDPNSPPDGTTTGTPPEFGNAPINKYYCNLMNAIGVKAGSDGFPLEGGTEEVTHFGMYDDTTDFASGGANPPSINDPGGFEALKAGS